MCQEPDLSVRDAEARLLPAGSDAMFRQTGTPTLGTVDTDLEFLARLRAGDEEAFVTLVARYQQPMLRFARAYVPSRAIAEEAVQDTWMGVVKGIEHFEGRSSFKTWLYRILDQPGALRRYPGAPPHDERSRYHAVDPIRFDTNGQWADPVEPWNDDTEDRLDAATWGPILQSGLEDLPARQRQVVIFRDSDGLSGDEVCDLLGLSTGNQRILCTGGEPACVRSSSPRS